MTQHCIQAQECSYNVFFNRSVLIYFFFNRVTLGPPGDPQNLIFMKILLQLVKVWHNIAFEHKSVLIMYFLTRVFLYTYFLIEWLSRPPRGLQNLKTLKILYRLFTKFAQWFIWIQKYFNNIGLKKERSLGPLGAP